MDLSLPENFEVGCATGGGDCFFDSFAQGLQQLHLGEQFTINSVREKCQQYSEGHLQEESWLRNALENNVENDRIEFYIPRIAYSSAQIESEAANLLELREAIWGRPDIEGRMLCDIYGVKLHVIEKHLIEGEVKYLDQLVDCSGSKSVDHVEYNEQDVVHIVNNGDNHFVPVLRKKVLPIPDINNDEEISGATDQMNAEAEPAEQYPDEYYDSGLDSSEDEIILDNYKLLETIRSKNDSDKKIEKIRKLLNKRATVDFRDANNKRNTPLHIAIKRKDVRVIEFLVKKGADVHAKNDSGKSPLSLAEEYRQKRPDIYEVIAKSETSDSESNKIEEDDVVQQQKDHSKPEESKVLVEGDGTITNTAEVEQKTSGKAMDDGVNATPELSSESERGELKVNESIHAEPKPEGQYSRRDGTAGAGGHFLKRNLLTYYKLLGESKLHNFYLAGNMVDAGAFHDVVLRYCDQSEFCCRKDEHVWKLLFIQAKHSESDKAGPSNVSLQKLALNKCVASYLEIRQKFNPESDDPIFTGEFDSFHCEFVVYNNAVLDKMLKKDPTTEIVTEVNSLLHFEPVKNNTDLKKDGIVNGDWTDENGETEEGKLVGNTMESAEDKVDGNAGKFIAENEAARVKSKKGQDLQSHKELKAEKARKEGLLRQAEKAKAKKDQPAADEQSDNVVAFKLKFTKNDSSKEFKEMTDAVRLEYGRLLAKKLAKYISSDKYEHMMSDESIQTYHVFLVQNVIRIQEGDEDVERQIRQGTFRDNFLVGTLASKDLRRFRDELFQEYATFEMISKKSKDISFQNDDDQRAAVELLVSVLKKGEIDARKTETDDKGEKLASKVIKKDTMTEEEWQNVCRLIGNAITYLKESKKFKFAKPEAQFLGQNAQNFMNQLRLAMGIVGEDSKELEEYTFDILNEIVVKILEKTVFKFPLEFGNIKPTLNSSVENLCTELLGNEFSPQKSHVIKEIVNDEKAFADVKKLVGNVLILDEENDSLYKLTGKNLHGDLQRVLDALRAKCPNSHLQFGIEIEKFPRLTLNCPDSILEKDVEGFLQKLTILTGKPSHNELDVLIKSKMKDCFKITAADENQIFLGISNKIQSWWEEKDEITYLQKGDNYFQSVVKKGIKFGVTEPDKFFIGRNEELQQIKEAVQKSPKEQTIAASQMVVIHGLMGVGKSELARKFVHDNGHLFDDNILWINADSFQSMHVSFHNICKDFKISLLDKDENDTQSLVQAVYQYFPDRKTLFIFDNAERYKSEEVGNVGIEKFLPHALPPNKFSPRFIITSQNQKWPAGTMIKLDKFDDGEALKFVKRFLEVQDDSQDDCLRRLTEKLQNHPLGLRQAADYLSKTDNGRNEVNIGERIESLCEHEDDIFTFDSDIYTKTVQNTMDITLRAIRQKEYGEEAEQILQTIAYLAPDHIPFETFSSLEMFSNEEARTSAVRLLTQYSLITVNAGYANVHRMVQQILRFRLRNSDNKYLRNALSIFQDPHVRDDHNNHYVTACKYARQNGENVEQSLPVASETV